MGKGTIGINPFFSDGQAMSRTAVAGLLAVLVSFTDAKSCEYLCFSILRADESSRFGQTPLDAVLACHGYVSSIPDHARRESGGEGGDGASRSSGEYSRAGWDTHGNFGCT